MSETQSAQAALAATTKHSNLVYFAGSLNIDFSVRVPHLPVPGETVLGSNYQLTPGGKGANQAVACARCGTFVNLVGVTGIDSYATVLRTALQQNGVHIQHVHETETHTGAAFIGVSEYGENFIMVSQGANALLAIEHLPELTGAAYLVMQLETPMPTVEAFARTAHDAGIPFVLNAAPAQSLSQTLLKHITLLVVNERELMTVCGIEQGVVRNSIDAIMDMSRDLVARGPRTVIVTLGDQGCIAVTEMGEEIRISAYKLEVVDTTGAGDTFIGVLIARLTDEETLLRSLQFANAAAALTCTKFGAQASMPTREEIEDFLQHRVEDREGIAK